MQAEKDTENVLITYFVEYSALN